MISHHELTRRLKEVDPVASGDARPNLLRMQEIRALVTGSARTDSAQPQLRWLAAAALFGLSLWWASAQAPERALPSTARVAEAREIHFTTAGGTQVIWVLKPDFTLNPSVLED